MTFKEYDGAAEVLIEAVNNYDKFEINLDGLRNEIGEIKNIENLKYYFYKLFEHHNSKFDGVLINTDNLNWRLPAQYSDDTTPWAKGKQFSFMTSDVMTMKQLRKLYMFCIRTKKE